MCFVYIKYRRENRRIRENSDKKANWRKKKTDKKNGERMEKER